MLFNPIELTELNSKELKYLHFEIKCFTVWVI